MLVKEHQALPLDYTQWSADVKHGLPTLPLACKKWSIDIRRKQEDLPLSNAHRATNAGQLHATYNKLMSCGVCGSTWRHRS